MRCAIKLYKESAMSRCWLGDLLFSALLVAGFVVYYFLKEKYKYSEALARNEDVQIPPDLELQFTQNAWIYTLQQTTD